MTDVAFKVQRSGGLPRISPSQEMRLVDDDELESIGSCAWARPHDVAGIGFEMSSFVRMYAPNADSDKNRSVQVGMRLLQILKESLLD